MTGLVDLLSLACLMVGGFFSIVGGIGLVRLPELFSRMHAASVTDTMGAGFIILGLLLQSGFSQVSIKLVLVLLFMLFSGPAATHALAKAALHGGVRPRTADEGEAGPSNT